MVKKLPAILFFCFFLISIGFIYGEENLKISLITSEAVSADLQNLTIEGIGLYLKKDKHDHSIKNFYIAKDSKEQDLLNLSQEIKAFDSSGIISLGASSTKFARRMFKDTPTIFTFVFFPEKHNIAPPGIAIHLPSELKLQNLKRLFPDKKRIGLIYSKESDFLYKEVLSACDKLGYELVSKKLEKKKQFPLLVKEVTENIDFFMMISDTYVYFSQSIKYLLTETFKKRIPVIGLSLAYTKAGALISFDCDYKDLGVQSAEFVCGLLDNREDLKDRIVHPRSIVYSLNLITAKRFNFNIPEDIIKNAWKIVK